MSVINKFLDVPTDLNKRMHPSSVVLPATEDVDLVQLTDVELNFQMGGKCQVILSSVHL
jgi:hypothetical protein